MKKFTNPLDKIKIASPCRANWDEMNGNERRRFCSLCNLNVYNLSEMTRDEAERFLMNSEGRVCLKIFRRADGTVLTQNCPVGWKSVKRKVSRTATAVFALIAGFFSGTFAVSTAKFFGSVKFQEEVSKPVQSPKEVISFGGTLSNLTEIKLEILKNFDK
jgi:hypothetical protein